jgi:tRNA U34 2-thiouridine synthase MnmA/TrmU
MTKKKAIALISGGLDSALAAKIVSIENIDILGLHLSTPLWNQQPAIRNAKELNIPLEIIDISKAFLSILNNSYQQWCIECRILMLKEAKKYLEKTHASFVITGEVLGQNSKSQTKKVLNFTAKQANLEHLILRPLSAKLLPVTTPEAKGWIKREKLFNIHGTTRKAQLELANSLGLSKEITSTTGCLLTNNNYLRRLKDLLKYHQPQVNNLELLKLGRHFRLSNTTKVIIARTQAEETKISKFISKNDLIFRVGNYPFTIMSGEVNEENIIKTATLCAKYSKAKYSTTVTVKDGDKEYNVIVKPTNDLGILQI